jgi:hypothetical protein
MPFRGKVTVCGGGNAAHVMAALLGAGDVPVTLFTLPDEVRAFREGMAEGKGLRVDFQNGDESRRYSVSVTSLAVTERPVEAADTDLVVLALPAFAHGPVLEQLAPHLRDGVIVGAIPSRSGFEYQAKYILEGAGLREYTVFAAHTLPWACRIARYGSQALVLGSKSSVGVAAHPATDTVRVAGLLTVLFKTRFSPLPNTLSVSLGNIGQVIHPGIMYGLLRDYSGEVWTEEQIPLFYQGVDEAAAGILSRLGAEITMLARRLEDFAPQLDLSAVQGVYDWLVTSYPHSIADRTSLRAAFNTNSSYSGLKVPARRSGGGFVPDFGSRYLTEDIPYGLVFSRAVAKMAGMATPVMDEVITWAYRVMPGHAGAGRTPEKFGIRTLADLMATVEEGAPLAKELPG